MILVINSLPFLIYSYYFLMNYQADIISASAGDHGFKIKIEKVKKEVNRTIVLVPLIYSFLFVLAYGLLDFNVLRFFGFRDAENLFKAFFVSSAGFTFFTLLSMKARVLESVYEEEIRTQRKSNFIYATVFCAYFTLSSTLIDNKYSLKIESFIDFFSPALISTCFILFLYFYQEKIEESSKSSLFKNFIYAMFVLTYGALIFR